MRDRFFLFTTHQTKTQHSNICQQPKTPQPQIFRSKPTKTPHPYNYTKTQRNAAKTKIRGFFGHFTTQNTTTPTTITATTTKMPLILHTADFQHHNPITTPQRHLNTTDAKRQRNTCNTQNTTTITTHNPNTSHQQRNTTNTKPIHTAPHNNPKATKK